MNQTRIFKTLLGPHFTEKATSVVSSGNQIVFKVTKDATKPEIKAAVEKLFDVKVLGVSVALMKGKTKQTRHGLGKRSNWKKAYVRLEQGQEIDFATVE
ncbi:MAG: 50S ribosomal protein L23 [Porticoccus sp.]|jgi:large subunit ribosomal protein L23|nr:50S ribosomal protein L23 [Porticoccus sp.]|tara:strand:+ start:735 stop:1031 length:297 start_codon:yes stop_codon:yes gene_type:complete